MPDIQWMNLDPLKLMEELSQFTSLEGFKEMLDKAQVGHAYMNRPCLDPNDPDCPHSAPNKEQRQVSNIVYFLLLFLLLENELCGPPVQTAREGRWSN